MRTQRECANRLENTPQKGRKTVTRYLGGVKIKARVSAVFDGANVEAAPKGFRRLPLAGKTLAVAV